MPLIGGGGGSRRRTNCRSSTGDTDEQAKMVSGDLAQNNGHTNTNNGAGTVRLTGTGTSKCTASGATKLKTRAGRACCFCWCCCCSCSCLTVPNNEGNNAAHNAHGDSSVDRPTLNDVREWGVSFDALMDHKNGQKIFAEFLKSEFSDENILFWQACEELKRESNPEKIEEKARIIYEDFISILSPKEVSLDSRVREIINTNMVHPSSHTFDEAQNQIYTLMQRDSYPRFVGCSLYKRLMQSYGELCDEEL